MSPLIQALSAVAQTARDTLLSKAQVLYMQGLYLYYTKPPQVSYAAWMTQWQNKNWHYPLRYPRIPGYYKEMRDYGR
jgi:hypothetical protein